MSLMSALQTASSALAVDQAAITVTGNNIANVGNADYSREVTQRSPALSQQLQQGIFTGTGVDLTGVQRQVDEALNGRLRSSTSDNSAAQTTSTWVGEVQSTLAPLSGQDLAANMSKFFTSWSNLANNPTDSGQRQVVLQSGQSLADYIKQLNGQLGQLGTNIGQELPQQANTADGIATEIAQLNVKIVQSEGGTGGTDNTLRDKRDADLTKLAQLVNISTAEQPNGSINVYVGSQPLIEGQTNHGLTVANVTDATGASIPTVVFKDSNGTVPATSGVLGALEDSQSNITSTQQKINTITKNLIAAVNQIHASGQGTEGFASVTSTNPVNDPTLALNNPTTGLSETPTNGSFVVHVQQADGTSKSTLVQVNLKGGPGDTTLNSLAASLNGINGVTATINAGQLTLKATAPATLSFSQDSSGTLSALGINTFFSGTGAGTIAVNSALTAQPTLLAAAQNGEPGDNSNAVLLAQAESKSLKTLGGDSLAGSYQNLVNQVANQAAAAKTNAQAAQTIQSTLSAQQQSLSGVSINEETINLMQQQQAFQAAARVVSTVNAMFTTLITAFGGV